MPTDAHITAAYHHERAAKIHRAAAKQSNQGAHAACEEHALTACGLSLNADEASKLAHDKSVLRAKSALAGIK